MIEDMMKDLERGSMWPYQWHFCQALTESAKAALEGIGFYGSPQVVLVGLRDVGSESVEVQLEPEEDSYKPALLDVRARAERLYEQNLPRRQDGSIRDVHEAQLRDLRDAMYARALDEALASTPTGDGRAFFSSR